MSFFLGCAVWSFKGWVGDFFPPGSQPADFLRLYSERLTTVEGNTTFYAVPAKETVVRWAAETPPGFQFCLKMPRDITHAGLLQPQISAALTFLDHMRVLGDRLGPTFVQLPPGYGPDRIDDLADFLEPWPRHEARLAVEVRHPDWYREPHARRLKLILEELGVGRVLLDTRPIYEGSSHPVLKLERQKPRVPLQPILTAPFTFVRFISHPEQSANEQFMSEWVEQVDRWVRQGIDVYFFVHCPLEERSPGNARHFQEKLELHGAPVPPLPWSRVKPPPPPAPKPTQLKLF